MDDNSNRPIWRDAPNQTSFRSYGGADAKVVLNGDELRVVVKSRKTFVAIFGLLFVPSFALAAWWFIPDGFLFAIGGAIVGTLTFALTYSLLWYHEELGD